MSREVEIDYTNWRGERRKRLVTPRAIFWGQTKWHPQEQWLLDAVDSESGCAKSFAMSSIHGFAAPSPAPAPPPGAAPQEGGTPC